MASARPVHDPGRLEISDLLLLAPLMLPLFVGIGAAQAWGSEARWLSIASFMHNTGQWMDPVLNGHEYWDKPLLSYWAILWASWLGGAVNEATGRLPSALAGVVTVVATASMAARLVGRRSAIRSAWILATSYSFVLWSRTASADALNLAFSTVAIGLYVGCRAELRAWKVVLFFAVIGIGGHAKGLTAVAVPAAVACADSVVSRRVAFLTRPWWLVAGLLAGAIGYVMPFLVSRLENGGWELLAVMWRENILRFFAAFDHNDSPFYYYAYVLPLMLLPWGVWLPTAIGWAVRRWREEDGLRFVLMGLASVFALFTMSESRRSYYILPAFPFCAILVGRLWEDFEAGRLGARKAAKGWRVAMVVPFALLAVVAALGAGMLLVGLRLPVELAEMAAILPLRVPLAVAVLAVGVAAVAARWRRVRVWRFGCLSGLAWVMMAYLSTGGETLRDRAAVERRFAQEVREDVGSDALYAFGNIGERLKYYLGPVEELDSAEEVRKRLGGDGAAVFLVCRPKFRRQLDRAGIANLEVEVVGRRPGLGRWREPEDRYYLLRYGSPLSLGIADSGP